MDMPKQSFQQYLHNSSNYFNDECRKDGCSIVSLCSSQTVMNK